MTTMLRSLPAESILQGVLGFLAVAIWFYVIGVSVAAGITAFAFVAVVPAALGANGVAGLMVEVWEYFSPSVPAAYRVQARGLARKGGRR